jgi:membrane-bound lytic murein transglycosylase D
MPATAKHYGVNRNWWYDGRLDLRESTAFALDYLEALHAEFDNDWLLALAAYNSGKGRVSRARADNARKGRPTDYWSLKLPRETRHYVPRLIALSAIISYPDTFDVELPHVPNAPAFEIAGTGGQIEMLRAADLAGLQLAELRALNPGQIRWATAPNQPQELLLPVGVSNGFEQGIASLGPNDRVTWQHYRIRRGDSLIKIARQFDTEVGLLREVNNIRGNLIRAGDTMMIPEGSAWANSLAMAETAGERSQRGYRVRKGDSLYRIAVRFDVTIDDIIAWNSLDPGAYLQPGQRLTLYVRDG